MSSNVRGRTWSAFNEDLIADMRAHGGKPTSGPFLGRPVLILQMPTNLRALVEEGVALGVPAGEDPAPLLRRLLFDPATREGLEAARRRYLTEVAAGVDGAATRRIVALIAATAGASSADRPADSGVVG